VNAAVEIHLLGLIGIDFVGDHLEEVEKPPVVQQTMRVEHSLDILHDRKVAACSGQSVRCCRADSPENSTTHFQPRFTMC